MCDLPTEQKVYLIECFYNCGKVYIDTYIKFRAKFGTHKTFNAYTLRRIIHKFMKYGTLHDRRREQTGPSFTVVTEDKINEVTQYFQKNPNVSVLKAAEILGISRPSLYRILKKFLRLHLYNITCHQLLTESARTQRIEFCEMMTELFDIKELDEKQIIFCDEAHFWLDGYVNKQYCRFWGIEQPNVALAKPLHSQKVTVWVAISGKGIYVEFFESTATAENYLQLLETKFFPHAKENDWVRQFYFMQDGTAPHRTSEVSEAIFKIYQDRVIGLRYPKFVQGGIEWPPYSPDLNPCDFFLWGYLKDNCYSSRLNTIEELIRSIRKEVNSISKEMLHKVFYNFRKRLDLCFNSDGEHFENIYH